MDKIWHQVKKKEETGCFQIDKYTMETIMETNDTTEGTKPRILGSMITRHHRAGRRQECRYLAGALTSTKGVHEEENIEQLSSDRSTARNGSFKVHSCACALTQAVHEKYKSHANTSHHFAPCRRLFAHNNDNDNNGMAEDDYELRLGGSHGHNSHRIISKQRVASVNNSGRGAHRQRDGGASFYCRPNMLLLVVAMVALVCGGSMAFAFEGPTGAPVVGGDDSGSPASQVQSKQDMTPIEQQHVAIPDNEQAPVESSSKQYAETAAAGAAQSATQVSDGKESSSTQGAGESPGATAAANLSSSADQQARAESYSPPVSPADAQSASGEPQTQVGVEVPAVSGLSGQEESGSAPQVGSGDSQGLPQVANSSADSQQQSQSLSQSQSQETQEAQQQQQQQQQTQQQIDSDDQLIAAVGGLQAPSSEPDSARLHGSQMLAENDIQDQFGRKAVAASTGGSEQQQAQQQLQQVSDSAQQQPGQQQWARSNKGSRSLKRAFAGHMGVFGRKRNQAQGTENSGEQGVNEAAANAQQQQQGSFTRQAKEPVAHNHHYYYQTWASAPTVAASSTTRAPTTRANKLKSADYPDYREILVQPEREISKQLIQQQQQVQQVQVQAQPLEEQRIEQTQVQVESGEGELNGSGEQVGEQQQSQQQQSQQQLDQPAQQQQQEDEQQQTRQQQEETEQSTQVPQQGDQQQVDQQQLTQQPYIRLSNIATINSTGSGNSSSPNGEVKLMRIYVIDLDQKLVVGSNQPGAISAELKPGQYVHLGTARQQVVGAEPIVGAEQTATSYGPSSSSATQADYSKAPEQAPQDSYVTSSVAANTTTPLPQQPEYTPATAGESYSQPQPQHQPQAQHQPQHSHAQPEPQQYEQRQQSTQQPPGGSGGQVHAFVPDGYVLLDRNHLNGSLTNLAAAQVSALARAAQATQQQQQHSGQARFNYSSPDITYAINYNATAPSGFMGAYTPFVMYDSGSNDGPQQFLYSNESANHATVGGKSVNSVHYPPAAPEHQQQQKQIAAFYPRPVQASQAQVHHSVPQYIAPQYKSSNSAQAEPTLQYNYVEQRQQQQPVRYNIYGSGYNISANNYTSKPSAPQTLPVQASPAHGTQEQEQHHHYQQQQLDKHQDGSGTSHLSVYLQDASLYQQAAEGQMASAGAQNYTSPGYLAASFGEPAQQAHNGQEQALAPTTYKVVTSSNTDQWRPVDYSAPVYVERNRSYYPQSTTTAAAAILSQPAQQQLYPTPAQSQATNNLAQTRHQQGPTINGYRDHDVVSLGRQQTAPGQVVATRQQQNYSATTQPTYDGQHAPLNYRQSARKSTRPGAYVNTQQANEYDTSAAPQASSNYATSEPEQQQQQENRPMLHGYSNDAPSQQVRGQHSAHLTYQQYNGTAAADTSSSSGSYSGGQHQQLLLPVAAAPSAVTNEYAPKAPIGYAQMEPNQQQQQYGTGQASAYGDSSNGIRQHQQADQSLSSLEAPKIPQTHSADAQASAAGGSYRRAKAQPQAAPSAYLAVSGPPVADGVYDDADPAPQIMSQPPQQRPRSNKAKGGKANRRPGGNKYKQASGEQAELAAAYGQPNADYYTTVAQESHAPLLEGAPQVYGQQGYLRVPPSSYHQQQRPGGNQATGYYLYQPQQSHAGSGSRGLLSWETISSVASGAAKRLPSLSSILAPFSGSSSAAPSGGRVALHHQYPAYHPGGKSAHYDRDVAAFHRPYPLRYMMPVTALSYTDSPAEGGYRQNQDEEQVASDHQSDLASSSSSGSSNHAEEPQGGHTEPAEPSEGGEESTGSGEEESESGQEQQSHVGGQTTRGYGHQAISSNNSIPIGGQPHGGGSSNSQHDKTIELINSELNGSSPPELHLGHQGSSGYPSVPHSQPGKALQRGKNPTVKRRKPVRRPSQANKGHEESAAQLEPEQVAVLGSIEQQLNSGKLNRPTVRKPKRSKASSEFVEPSIVDENRGAGSPISLESLPADQQRLLLAVSKQQRPQAGTVGHSESSAILFPGGQEATSAEQQVAGVGAHQLAGALDSVAPGRQPGGPGALASVHIGQYKITPQTQFVHSIIEPSRQMLGQYFKQYIGQLGQFAHG